MEILKLKSTMTEMKNSVQRIDTNSELTQEKTSVTLKIMESGEQIEKRVKENDNNIREI